MPVSVADASAIGALLFGEPNAVKTVLRRSSPPPLEETRQLLFLDEERHQATLKEVKLDLTALEFRLLSILTRKPGRIYSRDQLMHLFYSDERTVCDRTIDSHIRKLRKKISAAADGVDLIHSLYGVGYTYEMI